jgi:hypothetical protein
MMDAQILFENEAARRACGEAELSGTWQDRAEYHARIARVANAAGNIETARRHETLCLIELTKGTADAAPRGLWSALVGYAGFAGLYLLALVLAIPVLIASCVFKQRHFARRQGRQ